MSDAEVLHDKRIQASVTAQTKARVKKLVKSKTYDSEAEIVREALHRFLNDDSAPAKPAPAEIPAPAPIPIQTMPDLDEVVQVEQALHRDLKERLDLLAWMMTVVLMLMVTIASRILSAMGKDGVQPMQLIDEALGASVDERHVTRRKLALSWRAFKQVGKERQM